MRIFLCPTLVAKANMEIISTSADLLRLRSSLRRFGRLDRGIGYDIALPDWSDEENRRAANALNSYLNECGCGTGGLFMALGAITLIGRRLVMGGGLRGLRWQDGATLVLVVGAFAIIGKVVALARARWKLFQLTGQMERAGRPENVSLMTTI
jgi:hypothetical protein